jgi:hypothetical protein
MAFKQHDVYLFSACQIGVSRGLACHEKMAVLPALPVDFILLF